MDCRYCGASNGDGEHRCGRCGRRLTAGGGPRPAPLRSSAVPVSIRPAEAPGQPAVVALPQAPAGPEQAWLFADRPMPRVIPFESISPGLRAPAPSPRTASGPARPHPRRAVPRGAPPGQQALDFLPPAPAPSETVETSAKPSVYCKAPVARPAVRIKAASLDAAVAAGAWLVFLAVFRVLGGTMPWNRTALAIFVLSFALILLFYKVTGCLCAIETPGVEWAGLRLLHFDGRPADRRQRLLRLASGILTALAGGIGMLWALADEERLAWHDHMSSTFPTPAAGRG